PPPRIRPRATAIGVPRGRNDTATTISATTSVAVANTHGALRPRPKAPPELVVWFKESTPGITRICARPARVCSTQTFVILSRRYTHPAAPYSHTAERRGGVTTLPPGLSLGVLDAEVHVRQRLQPGLLDRP